MNYEWDGMIWAIVRGRVTAATYLGVTAEELQQEGRLAACEAVRNWEPDGGRSLPSYVFLRVQWAVSGYLQRMARCVAGALVEDEDVYDFDDDIEATVHVRRAVTYLRAELSDRDWSALWLRYGNDLPVAELAERWGQTPNAIRIKVHRARKNAEMFLAGVGIGSLDG